jgi:hypothetical protein
MPSENYYDKSLRIGNKIIELQNNLADSRLSAEAKNESAKLLEHYKKEWKRHHGISYEAAQAMADR